MATSDKLEKACKDALTQFEKIGDEKFYEIRSKLEYVIGSYGFDKNPAGLQEFAKKSSKLLKSYKGKYPRKVSKRLIDSIDKAIDSFMK